jgi:hypothetical protein
MHHGCLQTKSEKYARIRRHAPQPTGQSCPTPLRRVITRPRPNSEHGPLSEDPYRYLVSSPCARFSQREVARFLHTRRSARTFMVAARTSAQRAAFDIVSIVPSISMPWTTLPMTMTTARDT